MSSVESFDAVLKSVSDLDGYDAFMECLRRKDLTEQHGEELFRFLRLKAFDEQVSPSPVIDTCWHMLLLLPLLYVKVCELLVRGKKTLAYERGIIPHNPLGGDNQFARSRRYANTLRLYVEHFPEGAVLPEVWPSTYGGGEPNSSAGFGVIGRKRSCSPPPTDRVVRPTVSPPLPSTVINIFVRILSGETLTIAIDVAATVLQLKEVVEMKEGTPAEQMRLICRGVELQDDWTLLDQNLQEGSTVNMVLRLRGC